MRVKHNRELSLSYAQALEYARLEQMIEDYAVLAICHPGEAKAARRAINATTREMQALGRV